MLSRNFYPSKHLQVNFITKLAWFLKQSQALKFNIKLFKNEVMLTYVTVIKIYYQ